VSFHFTIVSPGLIGNIPPPPAGALLFFQAPPLPAAKSVFFRILGVERHKDDRPGAAGRRLGLTRPKKGASGVPTIEAKARIVKVSRPIPSLSPAKRGADKGDAKFVASISSVIPVRD